MAITPNISDNALIDMCIKRDPAAWDMFIRRYLRHITRSIMFRVNKYGIGLDGEDLKDIRQDVLSILWNSGKLAEIRNPESIKYWLAIVSGNTAIQYVRKRSRRDRICPISISTAADDIELDRILPLNGLFPKPNADRAKLLEDIGCALKSLPAKEKLALKLNAVHGKKYREISEIMSMPIGTVSSYVKRAKERLKQHLIEHST